MTQRGRVSLPVPLVPLFSSARYSIEINYKRGCTVTTLCLLGLKFVPTLEGKTTPIVFYRDTIFSFHCVFNHSFRPRLAPGNVLTLFWDVPRVYDLMFSIPLSIYIFRCGCATCDHSRTISTIDVINETGLEQTLPSAPITYDLCSPTTM